MQGFFVSILLLCFAFCKPSLALPGDTKDPEGIDRLVFGVYAHVRSTEMFKKVEPLKRHLDRAMMEQGWPVDIGLKIFPSYGGAIEALVNGRIDFVRFGPVSYVLAKEQNPGIRLLAMESNAGEKFFDGVISVPTRSPVRSVAELRGKRIAFGDRRSTTARYLAQAALVKAGISASDLGGYAYLGRHDKVAFAVASGSYDAGATNENTFRKYSEGKGLREILRFRCATKPWVARARLDDGIFHALRTSLLGLQDPDVLKAINRTGLLPAEDADYDQARRAIELAKQFDKESLTFGVYPSEQAREVYTKVRPVLNHLKRRLSAEGQVNNIHIKVFRSYAKAIDALAHGDVQLGRYEPASYVLAQSKNPAIRPVAREDDDRTGPPHGVFVVSKHRSITGLEQLAGKTFAFGGRHSTEGHYMAQSELLRAGISGVDLKTFRYLGRPDRVAYAVAAGKYDAGAMRNTVLRNSKMASQLKVIGTFSVPHKVWVAWAGIEDDLFKTLQEIFLDMKGNRVLRSLPATGFAPFSDRDYEIVREGIRSAEGFEQRP